MLTPGEIEPGMWVMVHSNIKKDTGFSPDVEDNPLMGLFMIQQVEPAIPHIVRQVSLPFVVVLDCTETPTRSKIWRTDEKNLMEVSDDFVKSFDLHGYRRGLGILKETNSEIKA